MSRRTLNSVREELRRTVPSSWSVSATEIRVRADGFRECTYDPNDPATPDDIAADFLGPNPQALQ